MADGHRRFSASVVGGVDTHRDSNVAAVVDMNGGLLGVESFPTTAGGHRSLSSWMSGFGTIERVGIEGTGAYGAGIARHFAAGGCGGDRGRSTEPSEATPARQERSARRDRSSTWRVVGSLRRPREVRRRARRSVAGVARRETISALDTDPHDRPAPPSDVHRTRRTPRPARLVERVTAGQRGRQAPPTTRR